MTGEHIVSLLKSRAGDALRLVTHYDLEGEDIAYIRDDLNASYTRRELTASFDTFRLQAPSETRQERTLHVGDHLASVRVYEKAVVAVIPTGKRSGTILSFDADVEADVLSLVADCRDRLEAVDA